VTNDRIDYTTHILIGVSEDGTMSVVTHWPYVPQQSEVDEEMEAEVDDYVTFILCTPTSIMPVAPNSP
jgi:hypothetical protein